MLSSPHRSSIHATRNQTQSFNPRTVSSTVCLTRTGVDVDIYTQPMGPSPHSQGPCFWSWGVGEQSMPELRTWWQLNRMEEGLGGGGLRFFLRFDPGKQVDRTLVGVSLPALFSRFLGWTRTVQGRAIGEDGQEPAAAVVSAAALAAAVSVCLAAVHASGQRPRLAPRRPRLAAMAGTSSGQARPRALPALDDGLRILSSKAESSENVIHGASIGAGDDEPVIVARVEMETTHADDTAGANAEHGQSEEQRQQAERLRELWLSLVEREQRLELRLQELEGLREQEAAARELESRVAAAATEARMLALKASSLQEENARLRARLEELDDARAELACAREKLREVEERVRGEREEAAALQVRVAELERGEEERAGEVAALREANAALEEENMELALRLRDAEQAASSARLAVEEEMAEQARQLRETNASLTRQIEQLRSDQYAHVEELVYLKWVNACLRHELSEHGLHPPCSEHQDSDAGSAVVGAGGMSAIELSKSMSFRSSERAKQLILRYGHPGLNPALFSPLHESVDGGNYDEPAQRSPAGKSVTATTAATSTATASAKKPRKLKFLGNFKKLLPGGKRSHSSHGGSDGSSRQAPAPMPSDEYLEKAMQWLSTHNVLDFDHSYETTPLSSCDRTPPSSATTATTRGAALEEDAEPPAASLARSRSDGGKSYGREAGRYHSLRPDHPAADEMVAAPPQKWERRRRSEELRSPGAARA